MYVGREKTMKINDDRAAKSVLLFGASCNPVDFVQCCNVFHQSVNSAGDIRAGFLIKIPPRVHRNRIFNASTNRLNVPVYTMTLT